jgi:hypothetical protein
LADAYENAVERFVEFARNFLDLDHVTVDALGDAFDDAIAQAIRLSNGVNLLPIMALPSTAGAVAVAFLAEQNELGITWSARNSSGEFVDEESGDDLRDDLAETLARVTVTLAEIENTDFIDRAKMFTDTSTISAAIEVGAHIARGGANSPFYILPWDSLTLGISIFAANVTAATVARLVSDGDTSSDVAHESAHAAGATYLALTEHDNHQLHSFNTASRVVEDILIQSSLAGNMDISTIHRLSIVVIPAFIVGYNGYTYGTEDEADEDGRALIVAACAAGRAAAGIVSESPIEMPSTTPVSKRLLN